MKEIIGIIGAGAFGSALGHAFAAAGRNVCFWARSNELVAEINNHSRNTQYMGEARFKGTPPEATINLEELVRKSSTLVYCCPSSCLNEILDQLKLLPDFANKDFVNTAKGLDLKHLCLFDQRVKTRLGTHFWKHHFSMLSGPGFAKEIIAGHPTCLTLAAKKRSTIKRLQEVLGTRFFRVYGTTDLTGVQLGGAAKNVVAIAAGIVEGLGLGMNTKAAIINLGLGEMTRLGGKLGAKALTFRGFSGMGDLVLTCTGPQSRNRLFGYHLGQGLSPQKAIEAIASTIEGIPTAKAIHELALSKKIDLPICAEVFKIVHQGKDLATGIDELLSRPQLDEWR
ncbi:NAD(P)-dependent glycerol-3-phosphate dehydrogenase [bacterium]|nr:NAD(P)-dependent glycerol-3-phosphate dehydrogenase [bacterium]